MKIAAISMVKDEADIIELFVRINARWADRFFILDNGSSDATGHILRRLAEEGLPISLHHDPSIHYRQAEMTTGLARAALEFERYDYLFPIDGDEFIEDPVQFKNDLGRLPASTAAELEWSTLVPKNNDSMLRMAPLFDGFDRRRTEVRRICKVVLPASALEHGQIEMGNHTATDHLGTPIRSVPISSRLCHVPVRSKAQIIAKTLIGSHKMSIKLNRKPGEVFHWDLIAEFIRSNRFRLTDEQLREIALNYGFSAGDPKVRDVEAFSLGLPQDMLRYRELATVEVAHLVDGFLTQLCQELRMTRSTSGLLRRALVRYLRN